MNRQIHSSYYQTGVSMAEIMIVMVIMAIVIGLAAPSFQDTLTRQRLNSAAVELYDDLKFARIEAMKQNATIAFNFGATDNTNLPNTWCYGMDDNSDNDATTVCDCSDYYPTNTDVSDDYCKINNIDKTNSITLHPEVTISIVDNGAANAYASISFDQFGKRTPIGVSTVITLTASGNTETITINEVGRITQ